MYVCKEGCIITDGCLTFSAPSPALHRVLFSQAVIDATQQAEVKEWWLITRCLKCSAQDKSWAASLFLHVFASHVPWFCWIKGSKMHRYVFFDVLLVNIFFLARKALILKYHWWYLNVSKKVRNSFYLPIHLSSGYDGKYRRCITKGY